MYTLHHLIKTNFYAIIDNTDSVFCILYPVSASLTREDPVLCHLQVGRWYISSRKANFYVIIDNTDSVFCILYQPLWRGKTLCYVTCRSGDDTFHHVRPISTLSSTIQILYSVSCISLSDEGRPCVMSLAGRAMIGHHGYKLWAPSNTQCMHIVLYCIVLYCIVL